MRRAREEARRRWRLDERIRRYRCLRCGAWVRDDLPPEPQHMPWCAVYRRL